MTIKEEIEIEAYEGGLLIRIKNKFFRNPLTYSERSYMFVVAKDNIHTLSAQEIQAQEALLTGGSKGVHNLLTREELA